MLELSGFEPEKAREEGAKLSKLDWTFEDMLADYRAISEQEGLAGAETEATPGGYSTDWSVRTDLAVSIIREERYKVRREINHQRDEERKAAEKARNARRKRGAT